MRDQTIHDLVRKAHTGTIAADEVAWAADMLRQGGGGYNRSGLLEIVGSGFGTQYEELVASFLECPSDPWLSRKALQVLCGDWHMSEKYVEELRRFLNGVPWDVDGDVRLVAMLFAGQYLRTHQDDDLLRRLWEIAHGRGPRQAVTESDIELFGAEGAAVNAAEHQALKAEAALDALAWAVFDDWRERFIRPDKPTKEDWQAEILRRTEEKFGPFT